MNFTTLSLGATQKLTTSTSTAVATTTYTTIACVRVYASQDTYVSQTGAATSTSAFLPMGSVEYFDVKASASMSFLAVSTAGFVTVTTME